ncbi:MAG: Nramp family divalent metal transporter [Candidatus Margulisiibacteriota bacterium]|jgi:NRAMP (natural resistance-associated macrophage protein)-like metal ion transporter
MSWLKRPSHLRKRTLLFLSVMGPGIITAIADNDAGGIATYSMAGSHFGYGMLWLLFLVIFSMVVIQEMSARMGAVTGKGLADLVREHFGLGWTILVIAVLLLANLFVTISEFAGIAASCELFGLNYHIFVPLMAFFIWFLVVKVPSYKMVERIFLFICGVSVTYIIAGIMAKPDWNMALSQLVAPQLSFDHRYILTAIAIIGTTITPWMQFYLQASIVDKGVNVRSYSYVRWDVVLGALMTGVVAFFIIVTCAATLFTKGIPVNTAAEAARALEPLAGEFSHYLFAVGLFSSSVIGAFILPLTTAYVYCEAFGFERGISRDFESAPVFFSVYTLMLVIGAGIVLLPKLPFFWIMLLAQDVNGILMPIILIFMLILVNNKKIMGKYVNGPVYNLIVTLTIIAIIALTIALIALSFV